jgi:enamine deaminase RidA (YjgF/YER057c/UK114 family)
MTAPVGADGDVIGVRDIRLQTQTALGNIADILEQNGGTLADVAKVTAYVVEQKDLASVMTVIAEVFGDSPPAVAVVVVGGLPNKDFLVELDAIAMI